MSNSVTKRSEILFCYDISDANPNGDPLDANKPRIDEETKTNIVTDVRLKRTIRDYLYEHRGYNGKDGKDIFVREISLENGYIQDGKTRAKDFKENPNTIKEQCIDVRLFGGVIPLEEKKKDKKKKNPEMIEGEESDENKGNSITFTGPVQFKIGRSLHQVELTHIKGSGAFASGDSSTQKTFREEYVLPYSFIAFHGIINEKAATHTGMTDADIGELIEGIWNGTKNLISRSKFGQMPRLLLKVTYKESGYFIGDLDKRISISGVENELKIRSLKDFKLDTSELVKVLEANKDKIEKIELIKDEYLTLTNEIGNATLLKI